MRVADEPARTACAGNAGVAAIPLSSRSLEKPLRSDPSSALPLIATTAAGLLLARLFQTLLGGAQNDPTIDRDRVELDSMAFTVLVRKGDSDAVEVGFVFLALLHVIGFETRLVV
jgi:hypothetical protein